MDEPIKALVIVEGVLAVLDDERAESTSPRIAACVGALERACELLGDHVDQLEHSVHK